MFAKGNMMKNTFIIALMLVALFGCQGSQSGSTCPAGDDATKCNVQSKSNDTYLAGQTGMKCKVQFNRNALGCAASLPVSPTTDEINGADVALWGTLQSVNNDAIIIASAEKTYWIPKDSILLVVFEK